MKNCPCCGSKAELGDDTPGDDFNIQMGPYFVYCTFCGLSTDAYETSEDAEKAWDKRINESNQ